MEMTIIANTKDAQQEPESSRLVRIGQAMVVSWKSWFAIILPVGLLPLPLYFRTDAAWCGYLMICMASLWTTEALPLPVTAAIPVTAFPLLGLMSSAEVTRFYLDDIGFILLSALAIATAVESSNLHKRISLKTLLMVGTSTYRLVLGTMAVTMFLSMWIPNTASASIMGPVALSVIDQVFQSDLPTMDPLVEKSHIMKQDVRKVRGIMMLAVMYSANIGGTGSIIGTGPNLVLKAQLDTLYPGSTEVTFGTWMLYNAPVMVVNTLLGFIFLSILLHFALKHVKVNKDSECSIRRTLQDKYNRLGPLTFAEVIVLTVLVCTICIWFSMRPQFIRGWADYIPYGRQIKPTAPALLLMLLLFVIPKSPGSKSFETILTWPVLQQRMQWGVMILLGGGLALADLCKSTGLSMMIANQLMVFRSFSPIVTVSCLSFATAMLTEVTSNTAICSIMLPVVSQIAIALRVHPLYLMMPVTIACTFSFMLPAATPVNAIVYDLADMTIPQMAMPGIVMNCICVLMEILAINYYGTLVYGLNTFPDWAEPANTTLLE
ncbi:solute carrier family 13 member 2-like [Tropilaelaps mercedesae]|uniref:Solute carrier family 13 member 2-like n=1 Tax=Tropilaelaps mercedesae TaxID=418985 RepID=A0A1V9X3X5_9ACAR|nr:solute carrier family 13 member 2-like [Tropilaelaps mercedesae]